jgi:hypothetical protein
MSQNNPNNQKMTNIARYSETKTTSYLIHEEHRVLRFDVMYKEGYDGSTGDSPICKLYDNSNAREISRGEFPDFFYKIQDQVMDYINRGEK